ncbi:hypothetical protein NA57DRAFT_20509, partial [Rhizodiscina lignyota]
EEAARLASWADLLILAPIDANNMAKMLHGITDNLLLEVLRSWDVSKKILLIPGMSACMWENPMTKRHLRKISRKWNWIRVLPPLLWTYDLSNTRCIEGVDAQRGAKMVDGDWEGIDELMGAVKNQLDLATIGQGLDVSRMSYVSSLPTHISSTSTNPVPRLPPEIWAMILEYTEDWELARALDVRTTLSTPSEWTMHTVASTPESLSFDPQLEWALLHCSLPTVKHLFTTSPTPTYLSRLSIKMIMRWAFIPVLQFLESEYKELFWTTFGHAFLPDKASSTFGHVALLEYWRTSPTFLNKEYTAEAMNGASAMGFVDVLEWWKRSGLTLKYTEAALEQASGHGRIEALKWWRDSSKYAPGRSDPSSPLNSSPRNVDGESTRGKDRILDLKVGKSLLHTTQSGHLSSLQFWAESHIPFPPSHEELILKLASAHGHVHLLKFWASHRGPSKLLFDSQVLVAPTKLGHADVLEWWREMAERGVRVEYKTCDIEEALEDGGGEEVRRWWAGYGLNLGVGTSEWMRTKVLG